jgi:hypothetical protein
MFVRGTIYYHRHFAEPKLSNHSYVPYNGTLQKILKILKAEQDKNV